MVEQGTVDSEFSLNFTFELSGLMEFDYSNQKNDYGKWIQIIQIRSGRSILYLSNALNKI